MDKGISLVLPSEGNELEVNRKNIVNILINESGRGLLDDKSIKVKEIRLRPKIGDHDFDTKVNNMGRKFLKEGFKLKVTIMFRGREISRLDLGEDLLNRVADALEDIAEPEGKTDLEGRRISVYFNAL